MPGRDGVRDCDVYVGILGSRYGWITPSGLSATEEELEEAVETGKKRLIFVEEVSMREEKQEEFIRRAGDYKLGRFWNKFRTAEDLKKDQQALKEIFASLNKELSEFQLKNRIEKEALAPLSYNHEQAWFVTAAMPDSRASSCHEASFNNKKLAIQVFLIGQDGEPPVFEITLGKSHTLGKDHWLLEQTEKQDWHEGLRLSIVKLYLDACVVVSMNVTGREPESEDFLSRSLYIYPDFVEQIAVSQLSFLDPGLRPF